jgi:hypothetical protein
LFAACTLFGSPETLAAQDAAAPARRTVVAQPLGAEEAIDMDGRLDEAIWQRAVPATDFLQRDPDNGAPATERTEVRLVYDRQRLYLGVTCYDSEPLRLLGNQMQRDQPFSGDDRFMWSIDTFLDGRSGYFFEINPSGAMGDGLISPDAGETGLGGRINKQWDGIWLARVRRSDIGWTAEIELPFRTFNFDPDGTAWGVNFQRTVRRKNEESLWSGHPRNQGLARMSAAGLATGLAGMSQGLGLDVMPYAVGSAAAAPGRAEPVHDGASAGFDIFYNVTPGLRANFTVNTDFAETEVDDRRVNLTRFPLFFPEKRAFFLEGSGFFDFSQEPGEAIVPFFSRRIGLSGGQAQPIDLGVKLTGQVGAQDVGLLQVRTRREDELAGEDFTILRVKRRVLAQSSFGMIYTRRATRDAPVPDRHTAGLDFELSTSTFRRADNLSFSGFWLWNTNLLDTGGSGAYGLRLEYPNELWNARVSFREAQEDYEPAVGFTPRSGYRRFNPVVTFTPRPRNHPWIRSVQFNVALDRETDLENDLLTRRWNLTLLELDLHSGDSLEFGLTPTYDRLEEDFEIHDGIVLARGTDYDFTRYRLFGSTADRRIVAANAELEWGRFFSGHNRALELELSVRPRPGILVELEGEWNRLSLAEGDFSTRLYRLVASTQFSPWMSLVNNVQYDSVSRIVGWQSRFRWILRPGNDVYFVYTHNWQDDPTAQRLFTLDRRAASKIVYTHRF